MVATAALALALSSATIQTPVPTPLPETKTARDARMRWWREARFGMFVHWGLYAIPAGEWNGRFIPPGGGEWIMNTAKVPVREYEPLAARWNPLEFDAKAWVGLAKEAGMKYLVVTTKHHDGFGLWPSKVGDWNVERTPMKVEGKTDILRALARECRAQGVRLCFYHSIMDWHHPDYLPKRAWDREGEAKANFDRYVTYLKAQLRELLTEYGDIGILWFDGEWEGTWTHERGVDLYNFVRRLQPGILVNNRVDTGRGGMSGAGKNAGDYGTPEQEIPANGLPGRDWESCMTMNGTWGYRKDDHDWKSAQTLVRNLIDCASKGGNYLLNVGPKADGAIPPESVERLRAVGRWMRANGAAIYATSAGPFPRALPWGRVTRKGNALFLHVFDAGDTILLPGFRGQVAGVRTLVGNRPVSTRIVPEGVEVDLRGVARDPDATVLRMDVRGPISVVKNTPGQEVDLAIDLNAYEAEVHGETARLQIDNIGYWTDAGDSVSWTFAAVPGRVTVEMEYACDPGSEGSEIEVSVGGQIVRTTIAATESWKDFRRVRLGTVVLAGGKTQVIVRARSKPRFAVMNLRQIRLRAAED